MKRLKKLISTVIAASFLFSLAAPASAATFSDLAGKKAAKDIYRLNALGIIDGYTDGTFGPDKTITRAEFAKIAMATAGLASSADVLKNATSKFKDVKPSDWFSGWVNLAAAQGYIAGYPDGTFKPNANISYAEAITILVRVLGYSDKLPGTWPTEYIVKAGELGITDNVNVTASAAANRADIASLASKTLDEDLVAFDKDLEDFVFKKDGLVNISLLKSKFEGTTVKDKTVTDVTFDSEGKAKIDFAGGASDVELDAKAVIFNGDLFDLEGKIVDYTTTENDDDDTVISYINVQDKETVVTGDFASDDLTVVGTDIVVDDEEYPLAASGITYIENGAYVAATDTDAEVAADADLLTADKVTLVLKDSKVVSVNVVGSLPNPAVVKTVTADKLKVEVKTGNAFDLNESDRELQYKVIKDGQLAKFADIKADDVIYNVTGNLAQGLDNLILVYSKKVEGKVTSVATDYNSIYVDGKKYKEAQDWNVIDKDGEVVGNSNSDLTDLLDTKVKLALDAYGRYTGVFATEIGDSNSLYGVVVRRAAQSGSGYTDKHEIKLFTAKGQEVTYVIDEDYYDDNNGAGQEFSDVTGTTINAAGTLDVPGTVVKYTLNTKGELKTIASAGTSAQTTNGVQTSLDDVEKFDRLKVGGVMKYLQKDKTVIFDASDFANANNTTDKDASLSTWKAIEDASTFTLDVYYDGSDIEFIVVRAGNVQTTDTNKGIYMTSKIITNNDIELTFFVKDKVVKYIDGGNLVTALNTNYKYQLVTLDLNSSNELTGTDLVGLADNDVTILDIDTGNKVIDVTGGNSYKITDETVIIDYNDTDKDPVAGSFSNLAEDQVIDVIEDADNAGNAEYIIIRDLP